MPSRLTEEEVTAAIAAAERYPAGYGFRWLARPDGDGWVLTDAYNVVGYLAEHPDALEDG